MAKKNLKLDIDTDKVDVHVERKDGDLKVNYDSKKLDVQVNKTADNVEVKVDAQGGLLKFVGNILKKVLLRRLK
jgi:hypothetical protein